jgi:hypothetical protein
MAASRTIRSEDRRNSGTGLNSLTPLIPIRMDQAMPGGVDVNTTACTGISSTVSFNDGDGIAGEATSSCSSFRIRPAYQPLVRRRIDSDHEVVTVFDRVDHPVLGDDFELDLRIGPREARADRAERDMRKHHGRADPEPSAWRGRALLDRLASLGDFGKHPFRPRMQGAAFLGETQRVRTPLDQTHPQGLFQFGHAGRDSVAFGPSRGAAGATEAAMDRHKIEVGQRLFQI